MPNAGKHIAFGSNLSPSMDITGMGLQTSYCFCTCMVQKVQFIGKNPPGKALRLKHFWGMGGEITYHCNYPQRTRGRTGRQVACAQGDLEFIGWGGGYAACAVLKETTQSCKTQAESNYLNALPSVWRPILGGSYFYAVHCRWDGHLIPSIGDVCAARRSQEKWIRISEDGGKMEKFGSVCV